MPLSQRERGYLGKALSKKILSNVSERTLVFVKKYIKKDVSNT
jgi:hypothetical protein